MKENTYHPAIEQILKLDQTDRKVFRFYTKKGIEYVLSFYGNGEAQLNNVSMGEVWFFQNLVYVDTTDGKKKPIEIPFELITAEIATTLIVQIMSVLDYWNVLEDSNHAPIP